MAWQVNWKIWHWPWFVACPDDDTGLTAYFAGVGPLQLHWWGR